VKFAGQTKKFREENRRNFKFSNHNFKNIKKPEIIIVDDIVTTGTTILEATRVLRKNKAKVLFAITLAT